MDTERRIEFEGTWYTWMCDDTGWRFCDHNCGEAPVGIRSQLCEVLIKEHGENLAVEFRDTEPDRLYQVMREMGIKVDDIVRMRLIEQLEIHHPEEARSLRFRDLPPAGHTPFNSPVLCDWFFSPPTVGDDGIPKRVTCRGNGPFEREEFEKFLTDKGVRVSTESVGVLVLGRDGWTEEEIDQIIEAHKGRDLRIYSQEMFIAFMMKQLDPLSAGADVVSAFRAGHSGLEYVSQGWPGWISTQVTKNWRTSIGDGGAFGGSGEDSPLVLLGYRVGNNGKPTTKRRAILKGFFNGDRIPPGGLAGFLEWGSPNTAERLKKMATHIAAIYQNFNQQNAEQFSQAIADWESDLAWMRAEFYRPAWQFEWPGTEGF